MTDAPGELAAPSTGRPTSPRARLWPSRRAVGIGLLAVVLIFSFAVILAAEPLDLSVNRALAAVVLAVLAAWGAGHLIDRPRGGDCGETVLYWTSVAWFVLGLVFVGVLAWSSWLPADLGPVERLLLSLALLGAAVAFTEHVGGHGRGARVSAAAVLALLLITTVVRAAVHDEPVATISGAGPVQLAAAARSGETVRMRGRALPQGISPGFRPPEGSRCSTVPIGEAQRSLIGLAREQLSARATACWADDELASVSVAQHGDADWGAASVEPVLLRAASIFSADPVGGFVEDRAGAPRYADTADAFFARRSSGGSEPQPLFDLEGRVADDGDAGNDTVLVRVSQDGQRVSVAAAFAIDRPTLSDPAERLPPTEGLEGRPAAPQRWLERFQPTHAELAVVIAYLSPGAGSGRLVRFTAGGMQPYTMTESVTRSG